MDNGLTFNIFNRIKVNYIKVRKIYLFYLEVKMWPNTNTMTKIQGKKKNFFKIKLKNFPFLIHL